MTPQAARFVAYYRVSTQKQGRSGLGLEAQRATVQDHLRRVGGVDLAPGKFVEVETGKRNDRPKLAEALLRCRQSGATLVIAKLDRLGRNAAFLHSLRDSAVPFVACDLPDANTLTLGVMIAMAQHEREMISARTKAALAARKARGLTLGTPRDLSAFQVEGSRKGRETSQTRARSRAQDIGPAIEEARASGATSLRQIAAFLNERSITTPRGKAWTATAVSRALKQLEASEGA